jgi:hypothetical protein
MVAGVNKAGRLCDNAVIWSAIYDRRGRELSAPPRLLLYADVRRGRLAALLSREGTEPQDIGVGILRLMYVLGLRALGLTWFRRPCRRPAGAMRCSKIGAARHIDCIFRPFCPRPDQRRWAWRAHFSPNFHRRTPGFPRLFHRPDGTLSTSTMAAGD